jgi:hypothetical protein
MPSYPESEYCTFLSADGRRCRTLKMPTRDVCLEHFKHDGQFNEDEAAIAELLHRSHHLDTPRGVSRALGSLFRLTAQGKLPPRRSAQLAYIGHLMLYGLSCDRKLQGQARANQKRLAATDSPSAPAPATALAAVPADDQPIALPPLAVAAGSNGNGSSGNGSGGA